MTQVVAMHTIKRQTKAGQRKTDKSPAVKPVSETIQPGTLFESTGEELKMLQAQGAVVAPTDKRAAKFGYGTAAAPVVEQEAGETAESAGKRRRAATRAAATARTRKATGTKAKGKGKADDLVG